MIGLARLPTEEDVAQEKHVGGDEKATVSCFMSRPFHIQYRLCRILIPRTSLLKKPFRLYHQ